MYQFYFTVINTSWSHFVDICCLFVWKDHGVDSYTLSDNSYIPRINCMFKLAELHLYKYLLIKKVFIHTYVWVLGDFLVNKMFPTVEWKMYLTYFVLNLIRHSSWKFVTGMRRVNFYTRRKHIICLLNVSNTHNTL